MLQHSSLRLSLKLCFTKLTMSHAYECKANRMTEMHHPLSVRAQAGEQALHLALVFPVWILADGKMKHALALLPSFANATQRQVQA